VQKRNQDELESSWTTAEMLGYQAESTSCGFEVHHKKNNVQNCHQPSSHKTPYSLIWEILGDLGGCGGFQIDNFFEHSG
jgi:hypothetical protein